MDIIRELTADHEVQRRLVDLLTKTSGDSDGRDELFDRLADSMRRHAAAEERFFYVPLMEHDETQAEARHSVHEHEQLDDLLGELEQIDRSSPRWLTTAKDLAERLVHHLDEEEDDVFDPAREVLEGQMRDLGQAYRDDMERLAEERPPQVRGEAVS